MYRETLPSRLKEARKLSGFTQREAATETGISHVNIARYESGTREPDIETLGKLAAFYEVSIDWLVGFPQESPSRKKETKNRNGILNDIEKRA